MAFRAGDRVHQHTYGLGEIVEANQEAPLLKAIVGFEVPIERLDGKFKLGQNRSDEDQAGIRAALQVQGGSVSELLDRAHAAAPHTMSDTLPGLTTSSARPSRVRLLWLTPVNVEWTTGRRRTNPGEPLPLALARRATGLASATCGDVERNSRAPGLDLHHSARASRFDGRPSEAARVGTLTEKPRL